MKIRGNTSVVVILAVIAVIFLAGLSYLFGQNQKIKNELLKAEIERTMEESKKAVLTPTYYPITGGDTESEALVIFETDASFNQNDKNQLVQRIAEPFLLYYEDLNGSSYVTSLSFYINQEASKTSFPYGANFIFKDGVSGGFLITKTDNVIDWWYPECLGECPLSETFKTKYPEIAEVVSP